MAEVKIQRSVALLLSDEEAQFVRAVCQSISGPSAGPRGISDDINAALQAEGIAVGYYEQSGAIDFPFPWGQL